MNVTLEIEKYNENRETNGFAKVHYATIDEAIANLEFMKLGFDYFKHGELLHVRLAEGKKSHLIDSHSVVPVKELRRELQEKYNQKTKTNEKEKQSGTSEQPKKKPTNTNFIFTEDEATRYAQTSSGEELPFKLFDPAECCAGSNLLRESQNSLPSTDFALVERRFAENRSLQLFGTEKIRSVEDVAWLFKALEDEAVEHAFLVYDFKEKGYFVQHISTGTFDAAFVDNRLLMGNVLEARPNAITLVHNHPSGNLKVSKADLDCIMKLRKALKDSSIKVNEGIIINLRSGKYVLFDENDTAHYDMKNTDVSLREIQPYSFSKQVLVQNYQPCKITGSADIAKFVTSQKFGISDKTEMLILNNQLDIVAKFLMPPTDQLNFIIGKVARFGGSKCILYGNNLTPDEINIYNAELFFSGIEILDALLFKSENGRKIYDSFADGALLKSQSVLRNETNEYASINYNKPNQKFNIMENNQFNQAEYLKNQLKYLGFGEGEKLHQDLESGMNATEKKFEINTSSDRTMPANKVDFTLKFNKSESGGVFLNSYHAVLTSDTGETKSQNFPVNRDNTFTAKEAVNLLEGRSVKIEFHNPKSEQMEPAFVKLNFAEPKTEKGNYNFQNFYKNYGVDTAQIVEKSNLVFDKPEYKESTIKSLEKGNIVKVKFELNDQIIEGKAVLNPQYKNLSLYDQEMTRLNTNKPLEGLENDSSPEKKNAKEQSIRR